MSSNPAQPLPPPVRQGDLKLEVAYCVGGVISPVLANIYLHYVEAAAGEWSTLAGPKWSRALAGKRGEEWSTGISFRFLAAVR